LVAGEDEEAIITCRNPSIGHPDLVPGSTAVDFENRQVELDGGVREPFGDQVIHEELGILDQGFKVHDAPFGGEDARSGAGRAGNRSGWFPRGA
jgi:hypothetical protein